MCCWWWRSCSIKTHSCYFGGRHNLLKWYEIVFFYMLGPNVQLRVSKRAKNTRQLITIPSFIHSNQGAIDNLWPLFYFLKLMLNTRVVLLIYLLN